jgi:hypothetical protein
MHGPLGQQFEDRGADITALAAASSESSAAAATRTAGAEAEPSAGIEAEFEAASRAETEVAVKTWARVVFTQVIPHVLAEVAARLTTVLVQGAPIPWAEAEAESAWWCEWVGHVLVPYVSETPSAFPIR